MQCFQFLYYYASYFQANLHEVVQIDSKQLCERRDNESTCMDNISLGYKQCHKSEWFHNSCVTDVFFVFVFF